MNVLAAKKTSAVVATVQQIQWMGISAGPIRSGDALKIIPHAILV